MTEVRQIGCGAALLLGWHRRNLLGLAEHDVRHVVQRRTSVPILAVRVGDRTPISGVEGLAAEGRGCGVIAEPDVVIVIPLKWIERRGHLGNWIEFRLARPDVTRAEMQIGCLVLDRESQELCDVHLRFP